MSRSRSLRLLFSLIALCVAGAAVLVLLSVGDADPARDLLARRVLGSLPKTASGEPVQPSSLLLSVSHDGRLYHEGNETDLSRMRDVMVRPSPEPDVNPEPVLLEVAPTLAIADLSDVLELLIVKAWRVNIAFLVRTPEGIEAVTLPVSTAHGCRCLLFYDGGFRHDDHGESEWRHVWLRARPGEDGAIEVAGISVGLGPGEIAQEFDPDRDSGASDGTAPADEKVGEHPAPGTWSPEMLAGFAANGDSGASDGTPPADEKVGEHPAPGTWSPDTLRGYVGRSRSDGLTAFVSLEIKQTDNIQRVLSCLASIKAAVGRRVVAQIQSRPPESGERPPKD